MHVSDASLQREPLTFLARTLGIIGQEEVRPTLERIYEPSLASVTSLESMMHEDDKRYRSLMFVMGSILSSIASLVLPKDPQGLLDELARRQLPTEANTDLENMIESASIMLGGLYADPRCIAAKAVEAVISHCSETTVAQVVNGARAFAIDVAAADEPRASASVFATSTVTVLKRGRKNMRRTMGGDTLERAMQGRTPQLAQEKAAAAVGYLFRDGNIAELAWGHKIIAVDGKRHLIQAKQRVGSIQSLYEGYRADGSIPDSLKVGRATFFKLAGEVTGSGQQVRTHMMYSCAIVFMR
jgi:hypothetical protein